MSADPHNPRTDRAGLAGTAFALARTRVGAGARAAARAVTNGLLRAWERRPRPGRAIAILFLATIAALGARGVAFQPRVASDLPSERDWTALRALVERDARPGDAIVLAPPWAERARAILPSVPALPSLAAGEDLYGVRRVWLVALPDAPGFSYAPELALLARGALSDAPQRLGAIAVTRHALHAPALPLAFLPDRIAQAEVTLEGAPCAAAAGGFRCAGGAEVVRSVRDVGGVPRPCLSVELRGAAGPLHVAFPGVPLGRAVRIHAGAAAARASGPVRITVGLDGAEIGAADVALAGFAPLEVDTPAEAGRFHTVELTIRAAPDVGPLCLDAAVLP